MIDGLTALDLLKQQNVARDYDHPLFEWGLSAENFGEVSSGVLFDGCVYLTMADNDNAGQKAMILACARSPGMSDVDRRFVTK